MAQSAINFLQPIEFEIAIRRLPNLAFHIQRASLPGISSGYVTQDSPFAKVFHSGDRLEYSELSVTFIVDKNMESYTEIFDWMHGLTKPQEFTQYEELKAHEEGLYSDITLSIKSASKRPLIRVYFHNAFPVSISEVEFDLTASEVVYPTATVSFKFDSYRFDK